MKAITKVLAALGALAVMVGCGGGGGGLSTSGGPAGSARVGVFVTDDLTTEYDHVWVTIKKVELSGSSDVVVYDNPAGEVIDLRALNQGGSQIFALLGEANVPAGNYNEAKILVGDKVSLVPAGGTTAVEKTFAGAQNGIATIKLNLTQGAVTGATDLVLDFDLSRWTVNGDFVNAVVIQGNGNGVGKQNQQAQRFEGVVSNLSGTAPNLTFDLVRGPWAMRVTTTETTAVYNNDGTPNPVLANGSRVNVKGTFDTTTRVVTATDVKIQKSQVFAGQAEVEGAVSNVGTDGFTLSTAKVEGFIPTTTTVDVTVSATTRYFSNGGIAITKDEFFAAIAGGGFAEAEGRYDEATNTLAATKVKLEDNDEDENENESEVTGTVSAIDKTAGTFQVTVRSWEGVSLTPGTVITVTTGPQTLYKKSSKSAFWAALSEGSLVEAKGSLDGTTLSAERLELEDDDDGDDDNGGNSGGGGGGNSGKR